MSKWELPALVGLMSTLAGCGNADLDRAEESLARWRERGPASYVYFVERQCYCRQLGPVRVVVENGAVVSAVATESGEPGQARTMTELLEQNVEQAGDGYDEFEARYDATLGYLKHSAIDRDDYAEDDWSSIDVSCFGEGTGDDVCAS